MSIEIGVQKTNPLSSHYIGPSLYASRSPSLFACSDRRESLQHLGSRPDPSTTIELTRQNSPVGSELLFDHVKRPKTVRLSHNATQSRHLPRLQSPDSQMAHDLLGKVSDFFDPVQIAHIIKQLPSVKQKAQALDMINNRREEIKELAATLRFQKYKPLFQKYRASFRERQEQKHLKFNKPLTTVSIPSPEVISRRKSRLITDIEEIPVNQLLSHPPSELLLKPTSSAGSSARKLSGSFHNNSTDSLTLPLANPAETQTLQTPRIQYPAEDSIDTPETKILQLPEGLQSLFLKKRNSQDKKVDKAAMDFAKEQELKRKKRIAGHKSSNNLSTGKVVEQLEKDIYTFLVNNETKESAKELILSPEIGGKGKTKWFDLKAGERFYHYQHEKTKYMSSPTTGGMLALQKLQKGPRLSERGNSLVIADVQTPIGKRPTHRKLTNISLHGLHNILQQEIVSTKSKK